MLPTFWVLCCHCHIFVLIGRGIFVALKLMGLSIITKDHELALICMNLKGPFCSSKTSGIKYNYKGSWSSV